MNGHMNVKFNSFVSSTCFEHLIFIIRKTILYIAALYDDMFSKHLCKQSSRRKEVLHTVMYSIAFMMMYIRHSKNVDDKKM